MAVPKNASANKCKSSPPTGSWIHKKSALPVFFKKSASSVSVKDSGFVNIVIKIFKACDGSHVCSFHLRKGQNDGFSKAINDAISSGELASDSFMFTNSALPLPLPVIRTNRS